MIDIPKLKDLYDDIVADIEAAYSITLSLVGKVFLRVLAAVQAGKLRLFYITLGLLQKNFFPDTADPEAIGGTLVRFGRVKLGRNPFQAVAGVYLVTVTGSVGGLLKAGTVFKSNDDSSSPGMLYILDIDTTLATTSQIISLRALSSGTQATLAPLDQLTATAPIANVDSLAIVSSETTPPTDAEGVELYRTQVLNSFRLSPQGGASSDYILWAQDAAGVARVYPYAKSGYPGEIDLFIESVVPPGTPSSGLPGEVQKVIEQDPDTTLSILDRGRKPLHVQVNYLSVVVKTVDINITGFADINSAKRTQIFNQLQAYINLVRPFIAGAQVLADRNDILDVNRIVSVILATIPGASFGAVTMNINSVPLSTYTFDYGAIPSLNTITYV